MTPLILALQEAAAPQAVPRGISTYGLIFQIAAIVAIIYFFLIRPQQRERKQTESMLQALKKGDEIVTVGGVIGDVIHIQIQPTGDKGDKGDKQEQQIRMDDRITIKSGESRLIIERGRIARVIPKGA